MSEPLDLRRIRLTWEGGEVTAVLDDSATTDALVEALPFSGTAQTWGEEVYFAVPFTVLAEVDAKDVVEPGTVAYWVDGSSLALPYGPTPISESGECRLVTPCNVLGHLEGDPRVLATVRPGDRVDVAAL